LSRNLFKRGTYTREVHKEEGSTREVHKEEGSTREVHKEEGSTREVHKEEGRIIGNGIVPDTSAVCKQEGKGIVDKWGRRLVPVPILGR
jgi:hypothetical protein